MRKVLESLGLKVNRLIRVSYGPFELGDLDDGAVKEIETDELRKTLGPEIAKQAEADFDAPLVSDDVRMPSSPSFRGASAKAPRTRKPETRARSRRVWIPRRAATRGPRNDKKKRHRRDRSGGPRPKYAQAEVMRVVGGRLRSRPIVGPKSAAIRPTADRLREALFNILTHGYGDPVSGARVLDLFAGTGALGIESISRGAAYALFVDDGVEARALLRDNVETLGLGGVTRIFRRDATKLGPAHPLEPFSLVFLDPPYGKGLAEKALAAARDGGWLTPGALVVVEEAADAGFKAPEGFEELERRRYDDTEFVFLRFS